MTSVNKVILVGNLGCVSRGSLDAVGQQAFDRYVDALCGYGSALKDLVAVTVTKAAGRLAEALHHLRKVARNLP